jgi:hypothetical protein
VEWFGTEQTEISHGQSLERKDFFEAPLNSLIQIKAFPWGVAKS